MKTKEMVMGPDMSLTSSLTPLHIPAGLTERVHTFKLLGLHTDADFLWQSSDQFYNHSLRRTQTE